MEDLIDRLPRRFLEPVPRVTPDGGPVGLREYINDLEGWIDQETGSTPVERATGDSRGRRLAPEVMRTIGTDPAAWYRVMLTTG
ncbi:hypothetical protein [Rhodococcus ruber]